MGMHKLNLSEEDRAKMREKYHAMKALQLPTPVIYLSYKTHPKGLGMRKIKQQRWDEKMERRKQFRLAKKERNTDGK